MEKSSPPSFQDYKNLLFDPLTSYTHLSIIAEDIFQYHASSIGDEVYNKVMSLLSHSSGVVREGALLGLNLKRTPQFKEKLVVLALTDESKIIRELCLEILEDWFEYSNKTFY